MTQALVTPSITQEFSKIDPHIKNVLESESGAEVCGVLYHKGLPPNYIPGLTLQKCDLTTYSCDITMKETSLHGLESSSYVSYVSFRPCNI